MCTLACEGGRGCAVFAVLYSFCGGLRFIISMAKGRSFGAEAEGAKGAAKVLHFCFWASDQREKGQKGAKKMQQ